MDELEDRVRSHYARPELLQAILDGARRAGAGVDALTPELLAPVDEFHTAGRLATLQALSMTVMEPGMQVLDAGCGIGGTARHLASGHGCRVTGIDLTPDYVETARQLTARLGLTHLCRFDIGNVTALPYADASFDAAFSFHVAMNVERRGDFYAELARVLKPGASFCLFDVMQGPTADMPFPMPWAATAATSFLKSQQETVSLLVDAGFVLHEARNLRQFAIEYFREVFARMARDGGPPPLGLHLLTGADTARKFSNYASALETHQIEPVILVARCAA